MSSVPEQPAKGSADEADHIRKLLEPYAQSIASLIHYGDIIGAGEQVSIPVGLDCGFAGTLIVRVEAIGTCERTTKANSPARESRLAAVLDRLGTTQGAVARQAQLPINTIRAACAERTAVTPMMMARIAQAIGVAHDSIDPEGAEGER
jgi:lambda repressor-like predicted transcriptional regulator